jgi:HTH-type transcriptional regulator/antitoxin HigA
VNLNDITSDAEHAAALEELDRLWDIVPDSKEAVLSPDGQRFSALAAAIAAYEERRWPLDGAAK